MIAHVYWLSSTLLSDRVMDPALKRAIEAAIERALWRAMKIAMGRVDRVSVTGITDNYQRLYQADSKSSVDPMIAPMSG